LTAYEDAESALLDLPNKNPDVVLMDINLPNMSGIECVRQIKQKMPEVLIIMLTMYQDPQKIFNSLQAGAVGYLLKNSSPVEILQAIKDVSVGGSPMSAQIARKVVQSFFKSESDSESTVKLTERETEILDLLSKGYINKEIADQLSISPDTVHNHLRKIYEKLHVRTRTEAVVKYLRK
jgi:DNA-binding NarL/FixJ family response regulator